MHADHHPPTRRRLLAALLGALAAPALRAQTVDEFGAATLKGAGSTFAHPLLSAWAREYRAFRNGGVARAAAGSGLDDEIGGVALDYEAIGSQAGIERVKTGAVDFAVSEMPLTGAELRRHRLIQVPIGAGAVAVAVNVVGPAGPALRFSPQVLAAVFLGRITAWNDPAIARLNPGRALPAAPITVVHRSDGSGTTYTFTSFLSQSSADWKAQVGADLRVTWPVGVGHKGSAGVARALAQTPNSIGYLDLVQALSFKLQVAQVQTTGGQFVAPAAHTVRAALAAAHWDPAAGFATSLVNLDGADSYPIVAAVFALASDRGAELRPRMARAFLDWSITAGQATAERLGYVALPPAVLRQVQIGLR